MEYCHLLANPKYRKTWSTAYGKELGRLAQGIPGVVEGTNTIVFIDKSQVPADRWKDVTYGQICANYCPEKDDPNQIQLTVGRDRINFPRRLWNPNTGHVNSENATEQHNLHQRRKIHDN